LRADSGFARDAIMAWLASNQLRLWFSAFAHLIMSTLQAEVLRGSKFIGARGGGHPG
jgi:hypothetical protein